MRRVPAHSPKFPVSCFNPFVVFKIAPHTRLHRSPYFEATVADGVDTFSVYNHTLMPVGYGDPEAEYWRLINGVTQWDVAAERQVQLLGKDAGRLAQILTTRDLTSCVPEQGKYVAICNHAGTLINDPILLKLDENRYWLSIADSNILFWARAIAAERDLKVEVSEPDVSPLAVQGPKAEDVIASIFGEWVRKLKYFWFHKTETEGIPLMVARSGWSKQGGFELYLMDGKKGEALWNIVREAGKPWDIGPGYPNACERIESGLLSWGGDTDDATNPFEVRMEKYVDLDVPDDVVGIKALREITSRGVARRQLGAILEGDAVLPSAPVWSEIMDGNGRKIGDLTNRVWSRRLSKNIGFALVASDCSPGDAVFVMQDGKQVPAQLSDLPFV